MKKISLFFALTLSIMGVVSAQESPSQMPSMITIGGENFYVYQVKNGDTFYSLEQQFQVDQATLVLRNPHLSEGLQADQTIKIPVIRSAGKPISEKKLSKLFDIHVVNQGETAYAISRRYHVALSTLMEDNPGLDPAHLEVGQKVNIRITSRGESTQAEIADEMSTYTEALNSLSSSFNHHVVAQGETLYSLGKLYHLPISVIEEANVVVLRDGLKMGSILKIPIVAASEPEDAPIPLPATTEEIPPQGWEQPLTHSSDGFRFKSISSTAAIRLALLLPLQTDGTNNRQFMEFYEGVLMALGELKNIGVSTQVDVFNTEKSVGQISVLLNDPALQQADLIIGPIYEESFAPVAEFAFMHSIPAISPLGTIDAVDNPALFQVAPTPATRFDKFGQELSPEHNVIVISSATIDEELKAGIDPMLPSTAHQITYRSTTLSSEVQRLLSSDLENTIVVYATTEVDAILSRISSVVNNLTARSGKIPSIRVIGSPKWARLQNVDRSLFFKLNVRYVTTYHADRTQPRVASFDARYYSEFSNRPTHYSYRGYDVAKLFVGTMKLHGSEFVHYLNDQEIALLAVPYFFQQVGPANKFCNTIWPKVCYRSDYTITVE